MHDIPDRDKRKDTEFAHIFADFYNHSHGLRANGKKNDLLIMPSCMDIYGYTNIV